MTTRRDFIKTAMMAGVGGATLETAAVGATPAQAAAPVGTAPADPHKMPRNMTLLSIQQPDGRETLGVKLPNGILDVAAAAKSVKFEHQSFQRVLAGNSEVEMPLTLDALLTSGNADALELLIAAARNKQEFIKEESSIKFGRLLSDPGKIVCVGLNYKAHAEEAGEKLPTKPILFNKYNNTLAAHNCTIKLPSREVSTKFDYETELVIVIGKTARNVSEDNALDYVAGYAVGHDFSARDLQLESGGQWMVGKTLDGFAPIGPYFVSADQVDPNNLLVETFVNDEKEPRQHMNTSLFIFNPQKVISYTSKLFALEPGDIIFTGTPSGVIIGMPKEKQVWLKAGDKITSRIDKLGTLKFELG
jgi:2-keto-4-pentenoate hydratase/2-oxohepta-3-ene-1,7-dioic acid hydratase in catechol pathway